MESANGSESLVDKWDLFFLPTPPMINVEEIRRIREGEPYCFLCGKPASSFSAYGDESPDGHFSTSGAADYVRHEEGTYNPATNRFACDACYIRIGMPSTPGGWRAP